MAQTTIEQFATELKMPAGALLEQLSAAGVDGKRQGDNLTEQDKTRLLDYLRKQHGAAAEPKKRITLTRKQTTEIKAADSTGKARTIQVEVRKKRVLVRREEEAAVPAPPIIEEVVAAPEPAPVPVPEPEIVVEAAPAPVATAPAGPQSVLSPQEVAAREEESRKAQALAKRQTEELK
jgi:translation initiation factor IF-2